jgi:hypothetical protein
MDDILDCYDCIYIYMYNYIYTVYIYIYTHRFVRKSSARRFHWLIIIVLKLAIAWGSYTMLRYTQTSDSCL